MYTGELIDRVIKHTENLSTDDADYVAKRVKVLEWAQTCFQEVWNHKPWKFKQQSGTVAIGAGVNYGTVPSDFGNVSELGGAYYGADTELIEVQTQVIDRIKELGQLTDGPTMFSIVGYDTTANQRSLLKVDANGAFNVTLLYEMACPLLADRPTAPTLAEGAAGSPNGTYLYKVTYVTKDGYESEPGTVSASITVASKRITVTVPTSGAYNVASRKIYRTVASGSVFKLLTTISDDSTTSYSDNTADGSLGADLVEVSTLLYVPSTYHFTVLLPGVISKARRVKGDTRDWLGDFNSGLAYMVNREIQRRSAVKRLPKALPGRMW